MAGPRPTLETCAAEIDAIDDRPARSDHATGRGRRAAWRSSKKGGDVAFYRPGARGADPAPACRPPSRRLPVRHGRAALARDDGGDGAAATPFSVAVFAPAEGSGCWDLARDHFGSLTPMTALSFDRPGDRRRRRGPRRGRHPAVAADERRRSVVARICCRRDEDAPRVIARLPFGAARQRPRRGRRASSIGRGGSRRPAPTAPFSPSKPAADISRGGSPSRWPTADLACTFFSAWRSMATGRQSARGRRLRAARATRASPACAGSSARRCIAWCRWAATPCRCHRRRCVRRWRKD